MMSLTFFIVLALLTFLIFFAWAGLSLAPWVPTYKKDLPRVLELAQARPGQVFYDLGCGDGRLVQYMAKHAEMEAYGLELNFWMYLIAKLRTKKYGNVKFKNLFKENLSNADVIFVFGMPDTIEKKLRKKLEQELKPGTKVITYAFEIKGWKLLTKNKPTPKDISLHLYQV